MSDQDVSGERAEANGDDEPPAQEVAATVEAYDVDGATVFYDAENPLAWMEASVAVRLRDHA